MNKYSFVIDGFTFERVNKKQAAAWLLLPGMRLLGMFAPVMIFAANMKSKPKKSDTIMIFPMTNSGIY